MVEAPVFNIQFKKFYDVELLRTGILLHKSVAQNLPRHFPSSYSEYE